MFPAQKRERLQWIVDTVRENQEEVGLLLHILALFSSAPEPDLRQIDTAKWAIADLEKMDRDALLQENGILTSTQIELLK